MVAAERPRGPGISKLYSLFIRLYVRIPPVEKKLYVFVCQMAAHHTYPELDQKLRELKAVLLMHSIWAARTPLTATELKDALRKTLEKATGSSSWKWREGRPAGGLKTTWASCFHQGVVQLSPFGSNAGASEPTIFA